MPARVVSSPTARASSAIQPRVETVAPVTRSPGPTSRGTGSPVMADSSIAAEPSSTTAVHRHGPPARTTTRSPTVTSSVGNSTSLAVAHDDGRLGSEVHEGGDRVGGAALGARLEERCPA